MEDFDLAFRDGSLVKAMTLGVQDIVALKHADDVVFRVENGEGSIEAILRYSPREVISARNQILFPQYVPPINERSRNIPVEGSVGTPDYYSDPLGRSAVTAIQCTQFSEKWKTIANLLQPRDAVTLRFEGDRYNNDLVRQAHLHADTLHIEIRRGQNTKMTFLLDVRVAHDNSARMVRMS